MKRSFPFFLLSILTALLLVFSSFALAQQPVPLSRFDIYFLSVGNADATLVLCDGRSLLIDGGSRDTNQYIYAVIADHFGLDSLDVIISTHPDADHLSGLSSAIYAVNGRVGRVYWNGFSKETRTYDNFVSTLQKFRLTPVVPRVMDSFMLGSASVTFISPAEGLVSEDLNDFSLVPLITYGGTRFIIAADMSWEAEHALLARQDLDLDIDVLRVAHHGGSGSTCYQFLYRASPAYAVISTGKNTYGHPAQSVLDLLSDAGCTVYRTDLNGTVHCRSDGVSLTFLFHEGL